MIKCKFRGCDNEFLEKPGKQYCSRYCKGRERYFRNKAENKSKNWIKYNKHENSNNSDPSLSLESDFIDINISYRNITHYRKLGYNPILNQVLKIKVVDLPSVSHVKILVICTMCSSKNKIMYCKYLNNIKRHGFYGCRKCSREKFRMTYLDSGRGSWIDKDNDKLIKALTLRNNQSIEYSESKYSDFHISEEYILYRNECRRITNRSLKKLIDDWDGLDYYDDVSIKENWKLPHNHKDYPTIDHKISIYYGFVNKIPPSEIGNITNLCITKRSINSSKRDKITN